MRKFAITVNGQSYEVEVEEIGGAPSFAAAPVAMMRVSASISFSPSIVMRKGRCDKSALVADP